MFRVFGAVFQRNVQLAARLDAFIPVFPRLLNPFLLGDGEIDADGIDGGDDGKGAAFRADQVADVCPGNAGYSVKRRVQHRIGKIFFSQGQGHDIIFQQGGTLELAGQQRCDGCIAETCEVGGL